MFVKENPDRKKKKKSFSVEVLNDTYTGAIEVITDIESCRISKYIIFTPMNIINCVLIVCTSKEFSI